MLSIHTPSPSRIRCLDVRSGPVFWQRYVRSGMTSIASCRKSIGDDISIMLFASGADTQRAVLSAAGHLKARTIEYLFVCAVHDNEVSPVRQFAAGSHSFMGYDTRSYFNVRSKPDISQLKLLHGTINYQEAQLSPRDRVMRHVSWNLANCHAAVQNDMIRYETRCYFNVPRMSA